MGPIYIAKTFRNIHPTKTNAAIFEPTWWSRPFQPIKTRYFQSDDCIKIISALIHQYIGCHSLKLYSNTVQQLKVYNYFIVNINVILISTWLYSTLKPPNLKPTIISWVAGVWLRKGSYACLYGICHFLPAKTLV